MSDRAAVDAVGQQCRYFRYFLLPVCLVVIACLAACGGKTANVEVAASHATAASVTTGLNVQPSNTTRTQTLESSAGTSNAGSEDAAVTAGGSDVDHSHKPDPPRRKGAGSGTPKPPTFTSTAPTTAVEGTQYTYTIAATDPAGGTVSYTLTTAPQGAMISGNALTWTPTALQARTSNAFVVKATTSEGGSVEQAWSVTPNGTIRGRWGVNYVSLSGQITWEPSDLSAMSVVALVANAGGSYTTISGTGTAEGTFEIPNVPAGTYILQTDSADYYFGLLTDASSVDFSYDESGRAWTLPAGGTSLKLLGDGLNTSAGAYDAFALYVPNLDSGISFNAGAGATSLNKTAAWSSYPLLDPLQGDEEYVLFETGSMVNGSRIRATSKSYKNSALTMVGGVTNTLSGTFSDLPMTNSAHVAVSGADLAAVHSLGNQNVASLNTMVYVNALPWTSDRGWFGNGGPLVSIYAAGITTNTDFGDITYGNPFPSNWTTAYRLADTTSVRYTTPWQTAPYTFPAYTVVDTTQPPTAQSPMRVIVGPVTSPRIDGVDFYQSQTISETPTITWQPPSIGTATHYEVIIDVLYQSGTYTNWMPYAVFYTNGTSLAIPPGILTPWPSYLIIIRAVNAPGMNPLVTPQRLTMPSGYSDALAGLIAVGGTSTTVDGTRRVSDGTQGAAPNRWREFMWKQFVETNR